jgi:hypothetical protein
VGVVGLLWSKRSYPWFFGMTGLSVFADTYLSATNASQVVQTEEKDVDKISVLQS